MKQRRELLISLRKKKNWFQKDIVYRLKETYDIEISESYYGMIEQGVRTPSLNIALAIAEIFKVNPNKIFFEVKDNKKLGEFTA
ncbi:helix-turn-helix transcriptional regulator [Metabacillus fastidiosus]|uniref:helix-turn-helix transcriptional regulator n=1 Tax=Metabacillus fastidiosus TaxID=1458 RepID=UPI003D274E1F